MSDNPFGRGRVGPLGAPPTEFSPEDLAPVTPRRTFCALCLGKGLYPDAFTGVETSCPACLGSGADCSDLPNVQERGADEPPANGGVPDAVRVSAVEDRFSMLAVLPGWVSMNEGRRLAWDGSLLIVYEDARSLPLSSKSRDVRASAARFVDALYAECTRRR